MADDGEQPLAHAVREGDLPKVRRLLAERADPNAPDMLGETPLFEAAASGVPDVLAALLLGSADPGYRSPSGLGPGDLAADDGAKALLELFQPEGDIGFEAESKAKHLALEVLSEPMQNLVTQHLRERLERRANTLAARSQLPLQSSSSPIPEAERKDDPLDSFPPEAPQPEAPLALAARRCDLEMVLQLLQERADPNAIDAVGETALFVAVAQPSNHDVTALLLLHSADPSWESMGCTQPADLTRDPKTQVLMRLFDKKDKAGVSSQETKAVLAALSEPMRKSVSQHVLGETSQDRPDALAEVDEQKKDVKKDLEQSSEKDTQQKEEEKENGTEQPPTGESPLLAAVQSCDLPEVVRLLSEGANPNEADMLGETPLFEAVATNNADMVAALLLRSADPRLRATSGLTALDFATDPSAKALLQLFGGEKIDDLAASDAVETLGDGMRSLVVQHLRERAEYESQKAAPEVVDDTLPTLPQKDDPDRQDEYESSSRPLDNMDSGDDGLTKTMSVDCDAVDGSSSRTADGTDGGTLDPVPQIASNIEAVLNDSDSAPSVGQLSLAAQGGDTSQVMRLLRARADPNEGDAVGETPLFEAAACGHVNVTALLLLHHADPSKRSLSDMVAENFADDADTKALLQLFQGAELEEDAERHALGALNSQVRELVMQELRDRDARAIIRRAIAHGPTESPALPEHPVSGKKRVSFAEDVAADDMEDVATEAAAAKAAAEKVAIEKAAASRAAAEKAAIEKAAMEEAAAEKAAAEMAASKKAAADRAAAEKAAIERAAMEKAAAEKAASKKAAADRAAAEKAAIERAAMEKAAAEKAAAEKAAIEKAAADKAAAEKAAAEQALERKLAIEKAAKEKAAAEKAALEKAAAARAAKDKADAEKAAATKAAEERVAAAKMAASKVTVASKKEASDNNSHEAVRPILSGEASLPQVWRLRGPSTALGGLSEDSSRGSAATEALMEVFRTGEVQSEEHRRALAALDPATVRCVLLAALRHLQDRGYKLRLRADA